MEFRGEYGLNLVLRVLGLSKSTWYYGSRKPSYEKRHSYLRKPLFEIAKRYPEYGVPRTVSELRARGYGVNHKVLERLNAIWDLSVIKRVRRPKPTSIQRLLKAAGPRINLVASLAEILDFEVLYTDITEIIYQQGHGKAKLMPIIDHRSKRAVGYAVPERADTELALAAWEKAKTTLKRIGRKLDQTIIHHDQDGVYRGHGWLYNR